MPALVVDRWEQGQASADEFFAKGLTKSTQKSYQSSVRRYRSFCVSSGRSAFPAAEDTLSAFVASLAKEGVSHTSLRVHLSAIRHHQIGNGQGDPGIAQMTRLEYVMKGIKRDGALSVRKERRPITPVLLKKLFAVFERRQDLRNAKMLWGAACLAFFAFSRVGEFTLPGTKEYDDNVHLTVSDVSVNDSKSPSMMSIRQSKTDQLRKGVTIVLGKTERAPLCPVSALLSYLVARGTAPGPLFVWDNGLFLTRAHFVTEMERVLELLGVDESDFNGHNFRI